MPYQDLRAAIDVAFREHTASTLKDVELDQANVGTGRYMDLTIVTMQIEPGQIELAMITVVDTTEAFQIKKRLEAVQREQADLVGELSSGNKRFADINKELQDANEELQTTNDELTARTIELHHLTREQSEEQFQLSDLLERFPYYVMVVDFPTLKIQAVNPGYALLLGKRDVIGQPLTEFFSGEDLEKLLEVLGGCAKRQTDNNCSDVGEGSPVRRQSGRFIRS